MIVTGTTPKHRKFFATLSHDGKRQLTICLLKHETATPQDLWFPIWGEHPEIFPVWEYRTLFRDLEAHFETTLRTPQDPLLPQHQELRSMPPLDTFNKAQPPHRAPSSWLVITVPKPGWFLFGWQQDSREDRVIRVPTRTCRGEDPGFTEVAEWETTDVYSINTTESGGTEHVRIGGGVTRAVRWDIVAATGFLMPEIRTVRQLLLATSTNAISDGGYNFDVFINSLSTPASREYVATDGTVFIDNTSLRIVRCIPHGARTLPMVNGALLTSVGGNTPFAFGGTSVVFDEVGERVRLMDECEDQEDAVLWMTPHKLVVFNGSVHPFLECVAENKK